MVLVYAPRVAPQATSRVDTMPRSRPRVLPGVGGMSDQRPGKRATVRPSAAGPRPEPEGRAGCAACQRRRACASAARGSRAGGDGRRAAGDGAGGRRLQQRAGLGGPGNARHRRVCVLGPGGEGGQAPRPGEVSRDESHGREAVEAGGPCGVCRTQVAVGGSQVQRRVAGRV